MDNIRERLATSLQRIASQTEGMYLSLSATYPELIRSMQQSIESSERMLSAKTGGKDGFDTLALTLLLKETRDSIDQVTGNFISTWQKDLAVFNDLQEQIHEVNKLGSFIDSIHEDSSAMELISLNAMTVALKAGNAGRAFSYITEELKRLSMRTIDVTQQVTNQGAVLLTVFQEFSEELKNLSDTEEQMFGGFKERVDEGFSGFVNGVDGIMNMFMGLRGKSEQAYKSLMKIMEEIQNQDLIRQSIEHIVITLDEIKSLASVGSADALMDELAFLRQVPQLGLHVVAYIREIVEKSINVFVQNIMHTEELVEQIEAERKEYLKKMLDPENRGGLSWHFDSSTRVLDTIFEDLYEAFVAKKVVVNRSGDIVKRVRSLDESFKSFANLISRFHTIDIASRIEIAKQVVLRAMSGTVDEMTRLTKQIEIDVEKSVGTTSGFLSAVQKTLNSYRTDYMAQYRMVQQVVEKLKYKRNQLSDAKDGMIAMVSSFRLFSDEFMKRFEKSREELSAVRYLLDELDTISATLEEIQTLADSEMERCLKERGLSEWHISSDRLKAVIGRFTILTHKKAVGSMAGFEVEDGAPSGQVTLF